MSTLLKLFSAFFKIGLFSIGGGYAMLPMIAQEVSDVNGWMTGQEVADIVAISQITPGPIAVNAATFAGMKTAGIPGALMATFGVVLPSFIICSILAKFFFGVQKNPHVQGVLYGVRPVVIGLIAFAAVSLIPSSFLGGEVWSLAALDIPAIALAGVVLIAMQIKAIKIDPVWLIALSALAGIVLYAVGI